ncbi:MAG TPA: thiol peroxidase [Nitrospira sp.]|nr:thiol peroxidase [Nitrospira sp.]HNK48029.1 thiol peroxidase [Nitrospira sp.]
MRSMSAPVLSGVLVPRLLAGLLCLGLSACGTLPGTGKGGFSYKDMPIADGSAVAGEGNNILFQGKPLMLTGMGIKVGDKLRDVKLAQIDLSMIPINDTKGKGKVRIISIVPSLDTKVCEQQTHYLSEKNMGLDRMVELITISIDTPFAQKRFAEEAKISNVTFLSDFRAADFGKAHGLLLKDLHLLSRALLVVDKDNKVRYLQITPELAQLPDLEEAFRFARKLVTAS